MFAFRKRKSSKRPLSRQNNIFLKQKSLKNGAFLRFSARFGGGMKGDRSGVISYNDLNLSGDRLGKIFKEVLI